LDLPTRAIILPCQRYREQQQEQHDQQGRQDQQKQHDLHAVFPRWGERLA